MWDHLPEVCCLKFNYRRPGSLGASLSDYSGLPVSVDLPQVVPEEPATHSVAAPVPDALPRSPRKVVADWGRSLLASGVLHLLVLAAFAVAATWWELERGTSSPRVSTIVDSEPEPILAAPTITVPLMESYKEEAAPLAAIVPQDLPNIIQKHWQRSLEQTNQLDPAARLSELDKLGARLESTSSARNVVEMGEWVLKSLNVPQRREEPATEDAISFDHATAQFLDVRERLEQGKAPGYLAVLVDAAGRRAEQPLSAAEGEELFKMFRLMEKHPLLREVYLTLALPVLDQVLAEMASAPMPRAVDTTGAADTIRPPAPMETPILASP